VEELHRRTGGNPFFIEELIAAREATLEEAVLARVARLDEDLLDVIAAAGGRATYALLDRLAVAPDAVRAALDAAVLVREREGVAFRHGLIGEVLYERRLPVERTALHRRIADELEDPAQRAHHCHRAGMRAEALAASLQAGDDAAAMFAYDAALLHYERALALGARDAEVLARAAQAARFTGATEKAVALCREAIESTNDRERRAHLYERLGEYHFWDDEAALACYDQALALAPEDPRLRSARGHALMGLRRWEESRACCEAALAAGAGPRITLGVVLAYLGEPAAGEAHLRRALELAATGEETARAYLHLGELLRVRGDHAGALEAMIDGEREAARLGLRSSFGRFMFVNAADDLLRLGRWDEAATRLAEAARLDLSRTAAALRRATAGLLHALRGDLEAARAELGEADDDGLPSEFLAPLAAARATLALAEDDHAAARAQIASTLAGVQDPLYTPPLYSLALRIEARAAERAPQTVDTSLADSHLAALDRLLADRAAAPPGALAHRALAAAEHARAHGAASVPLWEAAATAFEALAEPYPIAYARLRAAAAGLAAGDRQGALLTLTSAHAAATALGARPLLEAAEALARRARLPLAAPAAAARNGDGAVLTGREVEVVTLLADGLTNRQIATRLFISEKTVSAHMAHIYSKLDVHSRVAAAARAQQLGVLDKPVKG
jgi:DNA-binding CsgD family transcriptional regulator